MITNVSLVSLYVNDQDEARDFYVDKLGFAPHTDVRMGDGFRWVTIIHSDHPELEVTLMVPGPPLDQEMADAVRRAMANGNMGGFGLQTTDCHKDYDDLVSKGVEFTQPPADRPYGIEAIMRDNSGNWLVLVEQKPYSPEDFAE